MNSITLLARLRGLRVPVITTADVRAITGGTIAGASKALTRLGAAGVLTQVRRGLWSLEPKLDPVVLAEYLSSPMPSYVSLQTALYRRGLIEQIPAVTYLITLGHPQCISTRMGTFSLHQIAPELFGGFEILESGGKLATAEKALVDFLYLSGSKNRLFAALPEIELPKDFDKRSARRWIERIALPRLKTLVQQRWDQWVRPYLRS